MTPELAAERAAHVLGQAAAVAHEPPEWSAALVSIADGWTRLHTALANAPKTIEPPTPDEPYEFGIDRIMRANEQRKRATGSDSGRVSGSLAFSDVTPIMTCQCGVRCFGDSINDALAAWGAHLTTLHRNDL